MCSALLLFTVALLLCMVWLPGQLDAQALLDDLCEIKSELRTYTACVRVQPVQASSSTTLVGSMGLQELLWMHCERLPWPSVAGCTQQCCANIAYQVALNAAVYAFHACFVQKWWPARLFYGQDKKEQ
jgi:hypothetical protein